MELKINGEIRNVDVEDNMPLLWVLRDELDMTGTKYGCGVSACGACTVQIDGVATRTCTLPVSAAVGKEIKTIEGIAENKSICWAICLKDKPKLIGTIGYYRTQFEHYRTEIGYELSPEFWGKGMASEAVQAALNYVFFKTKKLHFFISISIVDCV